jgi:tetratricopeptide (TPR) repeat protein
VGGGGWAWYGFPYYATIGPNGPVFFAQPFFAPWALPMMIDRGALGGPMPPPMRVGGLAPAPPAKKADPGKSAQLVTIGDRLFRAGNLKRAGERYEQAVRADPDAAAPRVRLAQLALVRGQYGEAAEQLRAAVAVEPGFLINARDIQTIYAEPADFNRQISRLESHLLVSPGDRDAWLVLGAQLYLSGQTRRAADVFLRLTDRKTDPALAAFLDASNPKGKDQK